MEKKICPRCGTELMEDNFCMGCGTYVEPEEKKDESESESFGSFGSSGNIGISNTLGIFSDTSGSLGILGDSQGSDATGTTGDASGDAQGSSSTPASPFGDQPLGIITENGVVTDPTSFGVFGGGIGGGDLNNDSFANANGEKDRAAEENSTSYGGTQSSGGINYGDSGKPPVFKSLLIMAAIAMGVFLLVFAVDAMTKVKDKVTTLYLHEPEEGLEGTMRITAGGDVIKQLEDEEVIDVGSSEAAKLLEDYAYEYYEKYDKVDTISVKIENQGTSVKVTITYFKLDDSRNLKKLIANNFLDIASDADYVSLEKTLKNLKNQGWSETLSLDYGR